MLSHFINHDLVNKLLITKISPAKNINIFQCFSAGKSVRR